MKGLHHSGEGGGERLLCDSGSEHEKGRKELWRKSANVIADGMEKTLSLIHI